MKNHYLWITGITIAFFAGAVVFDKAEAGTILPFVLLLICPVMMMLMMGGHKHK